MLVVNAMACTTLLSAVTLWCLTIMLYISNGGAFAFFVCVVSGQLGPGVPTPAEMCARPTQTGLASIYMHRYPSASTLTLTKGTLREAAGRSLTANETAT